MNAAGFPQFPRLRRKFTQAMVNRYGRVNEDRNLIHYETGAAKRAGFTRPVVHGALVAALISEACRDYFGQPWLKCGQLKVAFVKPVLVEQAVLTGARLIEADASRSNPLVHLEVWCENEVGERVVAGSATCRYSRDSSASAD